MSSFIRSRAQVSSRDSFLLTISGCQLFNVNTFNLTYGKSVVNISEEGNDSAIDLSYATLPAQQLLRDMGRSVTLFQNDATTGNRAVKVAVLREVQKVNGTGTEGVRDTAAYLTPVWVDVSPQTSDGASMVVLVTRCG